MIFTLIYLLLGALAAYKKSYNWFAWFTTFALLGLIVEMTLAYINKFIINIINFFIIRFNLGLFFCRIIAYIYGKYF